MSCWLCVQKHDLALGRVLAQALAVHPSASGLWVLAARTQMEQSRDIAAARYVACMAAVTRVPQTYNVVRSGRSLLQRGIRSNPHSHHLWHEAFRLELLHVDKVQRRQEVLGLEGEVCVCVCVWTCSQHALGCLFFLLRQETASSSDAFMLHQTASAVYRQAVTTIPGGPAGWVGLWKGLGSR